MTVIHQTIHDANGIILKVEDDKGRLLWVETKREDAETFKINAIGYPIEQQWGHHMFQASIEVRDAVVDWFNDGGAYTMKSGAISTETIRPGYNGIEPDISPSP